MRAMHETMRMKDLQIFANRNLRSFELARKFGDQHTTLMRDEIENGAAAFFVKHDSCVVFLTERSHLPSFFL